MLDLSFGLPIVVRDAALKMVAPGPQSTINREYYAQEHEKEIEEGRGAVEEYDKTDEKARELLRRLAHSGPYYRRPRRPDAAAPDAGDGGDTPSEGTAMTHSHYGNAPGPIRTGDSRRGSGFRGRGGRGMRGGGGRGGGGRGGGGGWSAGGARPFPGTAQLPPTAEDILPPADPNVTSLFVTGVEDDLPEHLLRTFFTQFGQLRSLVCSHRSHCAFINYASRESAEAAARQCQGKAVIQGCPLRIRWGKPKPLDNLDREERMKNAREGRQTAAAGRDADTGRRALAAAGEGGPQEASQPQGYAVAPPPGHGEAQYSSLSGD